MMTLNEAIKHCKEVSDTCSNTECAKEHLQLVTWLKELQFYRDKYQKSNKTMELIDKDALVAEIKRKKDICKKIVWDLQTQENIDYYQGKAEAYSEMTELIDTIEVKETYEQRIQYASIEDGIKAHAETYSFNIESELFNQLTKEQQTLWRREIEQACISGGEVGVELARDVRYKENIEMKEVNLEKELNIYLEKVKETDEDIVFKDFAKHFFELGIAVSKKEQKGEYI